MTDIINNDPVIKELDKELEAIGQRTYNASIDSLEKERNRYINSVQDYCIHGFLTEEQRDNCLTKFNEVYEKKLIKYKQNPNSMLGNPFSTFFITLRQELEKMKKVNQLSDTYGEEIAKKLAYNHEVWIGMSRAELEISRGRPSDIEKEMTQKGEIEKFVYGNKNTGSYFTISNGKVTKIKDRDDHRTPPGSVGKIWRGDERMFE